MSLLQSRPVLRWLTPLVFLLVVGGTAVVATSATAKDKLAPRTAEQLLVDVQQAEIDGLSGTVVQRADLGIPDIPGAGGSDSSEFNSLVSGSHTLRVWYSAPDKARIALLGELGESDLITNGADVWTWSSDENAATHRTVDRDAAERDEPTTPADVPKTPQEAAERFLTAVGPTTDVTTDSDVTVARRDAYELVLTPKPGTPTLITQVRIAVDGLELVPLRVQVFAGAAEPVAEVAYTDVDFNRPDDAQFDFKPPPGAEVTEVPSGKPSEEEIAKAKQRRDAAGRPTVVGQAWTAVVVGAMDADSGSNGGTFEALREQLPRVSGDWGSGRVLAGPAFSVVITDDGRFAAGAVKPELLYEALGE